MSNRCPSPLTTKHRPHRSGGFTMIELMTVIAIIAILMVALVVVAGRAIQDSKSQATLVTMNTLNQAISQFYNVTGTFPPDANTVRPGATDYASMSHEERENQRRAWMLEILFAGSESTKAPVLPGEEAPPEGQLSEYVKVGTTRNQIKQGLVALNVIEEDRGLEMMNDGWGNLIGYSRYLPRNWVPGQPVPDGASVMLFNPQSQYRRLANNVFEPGNPVLISGGPDGKFDLKTDNGQVVKIDEDNLYFPEN